MSGATTIRDAVISGEPIIQLNVPYSMDGERDEFEAQLPESFADIPHALERAENRLPEDATFVDEPYRVGQVPDYDPNDVMME